MRILISVKVDDDIKKCCRKKWYEGIDKEFPRVLRYLQAKGLLPGESPFHYLVKELLNKTVLHAGICLPNYGKQKGPRLIYYINKDKSEASILYVGGHKDNIYDTPKIVDLLKDRFIGDFYCWSDKESQIS